MCVCVCTRLGKGNYKFGENEPANERNEDEWRKQETNDGKTEIENVIKRVMQKI